MSTWNFFCIMYSRSDGGKSAEPADSLVSFVIERQERWWYSG